MTTRAEQATRDDAIRERGINLGVRLAAQLVRDHVDVGGDGGEAVALFLESRADRVMILTTEDETVLTVDLQALGIRMRERYWATTYHDRDWSELARGTVADFRGRS